MARFAFAVNAFNGSFRNGRLWLIQFLVNPLLFALFTAWLLIPVANAGYLILNILFALVLLVASLVLHGGTLNYFSSRGRSEGATLRAAFHCALRNVLAVVAGVAIVYLLWALVGKAGSHQETLPAYVRSALPAFLRRQVGLPFFQGLFDAVLFALRWILIPGLLLPLLARVSQFGLFATTFVKMACRKHTSIWKKRLNYRVGIGRKEVGFARRCGRPAACGN